jgi:NAD(P)-dependent dehydrogenase (short-subunit alcohol dehydrogenase family)
MVSLKNRLESKVIVVTGGSSGIGLAVAERVAAEGAAVVIGARREDVGARAAELIRADGGRAVFVRTDVTVEADVAGLIRRAVEEFGRLDGAFNNAGSVGSFGDVAEVSDEAWQEDLAINLTSVFHCLRHQIPAILASGGGSIVNNASILGVAAVPGMSPYIAAKHGVVGLTRAAALEGAKQNLRVNALVTGNVDTPLLRGFIPPEASPDTAAPNPTGRLARPEEIAAFVAFLLSDECPFLTGAALAVDGGFTAQ